MSGTLYLVGTPIGNLGDLSVRALETLRSADFIAAEDTRVTAKLLNHFEIKKPCVSYYEHNKYASGEKIVARLLAGETCALVTDAGMPAISDPGEDIVPVRRAGHRRAGHPRPVRGHRGAGRVRPADAAVLLRGLPRRERQDPARAS